MRVARSIVALAQAALVACLFAGGAKAQQCVEWSKYSCADKPKSGVPAPGSDVIRLGVTLPKGELIGLDPLKLYQVDIACRVAQRLPAAREGIFNRTDVVTTHVIAITGKRLTKPELPTNAKVLIPVYSVSTAKANQWDFVNKTCDQSFFVSGRKSLFISATANQTRKNSPGAFSNLLYSGLKLFNPIWPLFAGATAVAAVQPILNGIAATEAPLKEMFSQFDASGTQTYSYPLYVGETIVPTTYTRTTVTVKEVPSVVQTDNKDFITGFESSLAGFATEVRNPQVTAEFVASYCGSDANQLLNQSFPRYDVAYALTFITRIANLDKEKSVACIGKDYGLLSVEKFTCPPSKLKCLWTRFPNPLTVADFPDPDPIQKFDLSFFKGLRNALDAYAWAGPDGDDASRASLAEFVQDEIEFEDLDGLVEGGNGKITMVEFAKQLVSSNYTKFGCPTKDPQAAGLLFGFPPSPAADGLYHGEDVVAFRTWRGNPPKPGKIFKVEALFQPGLAEAAARPTLMWCGKGLHLARTPEPQQQGGAGGGAGGGGGQ